MEKATQYYPLGNNDVGVYSREQVQSGRIMSGRGMYSEDEKRFAFVQNPKRENYSKLILASGHASLRRRKNGVFSINITFEQNEKYIKDALISEVRGLAQAAVDYKEETNETTEKK